VPAAKKKYEIDEIEPDETTILSFYPEIARCVSCNTCTKACPQDINVMMYIQNSLRGNIARAAEISFDCIQCGMCAMRCPADIKHYHVAQLARRLRGKYIDPRSGNLKTRLGEIEAGQYEKEIDELIGKPMDQVKEMYAARKLESDASEGTEGGED